MELAAIQHRLASARLVTLIGAGGSGKTRLALEAARAALAHFPDGVWLVELAPLADPDLVPQTAAAALGLHGDAGRPSLAALIEHLRSRMALLILDNCEHVITACAMLAETLLSQCLDLRLLIASREALGIPGETTYPVPSLSLPDHSGDAAPMLEALTQSEAPRLFIERAKTIMPDFELTAANAAAAAQICRRLDGIPMGSGKPASTYGFWTGGPACALSWLRMRFNRLWPPARG